MQYFGVPKCPYCKKRVNLIRTWSLKSQGEYQCPRCGGISNIFLSPLIYILALLAVFAGGVVYFFHKFVLNDISLSTMLQVLIPFAAFFLLSLFMVYLAKPVIKKIPKAEMDKKRRRNVDRRDTERQPASQRQEMFYDDQEYLPKSYYRTGPMPEDDRDMKILPNGGSSRYGIQGSEVPKESYRIEASPRIQSSPARRMEIDTPAHMTPTHPQRAAAEPTRRAESADTLGQQNASVPQPPKAEPVSVSNEDFFAKYDDPDYVNRRLRELQRGQEDEK